MSNHIHNILEEEKKKLSYPLNNGYTLLQYKLAPSARGELADVWEDKPARLVYDLIDEIVALRADMEKMKGALQLSELQLKDANERLKAIDSTAIPTAVPKRKRLKMIDHNELEEGMAEIANERNDPLGVEGIRPYANTNYDETQPEFWMQYTDAELAAEPRVQRVKKDIVQSILQQFADKGRISEKQKLVLARAAAWGS